MHNKNWTRRAMVVAAAAGLLALAPAAPGEASPAPQRCGTVLTANTTLRADLTCTGDGLFLGADGITLNLGGHVLRGSGTGVGIGTNFSRRNLIVKTALSPASHGTQCSTTRIR
jgi:hypothetical protein